MLIRKKISQSKKMVLIAVLAVILLVIIYLLYTNFFPGGFSLTGAPDADLDLGLRMDEETAGPAVTVKEIKADLPTDFLSQSPFKDLKQYGTLPVTVDQMGRPNPFEPSSGLIQPKE